MATGPQVFRPGVKYVKLAKFDTGSVSNDLTIPLGEIKKIRVNYSDKGIVEYPIQTITEYPDYYLYRVATTDATSSSDNDTPDFNAVLESAFFSRVPSGSGNIVSNGLGATTITSSNVSYNSTSGEVVFSKSTQIQMVLSASLETNNSTGDLNLVSNKRGVIYTARTIGSPATASITSLFTPFTDEVLTLTYTDTGSGGAFQTVRWSMTTGSGAYTVTNGTQIPTVLEPFFESKFTNEDCDVLLGNATEPRLSTLYFDIDYSTAQISPVNLQAILTGSAVRAQTPDSNYTSIRSITPRYEGSKNTDPIPLEILSIVLGQPIWTKNPHFDRQLIQSTSSLAPLNNYISAIVEYEDISISGSDNKLQNERVPNNIIFIESTKPGQAIFQSIQGSTQTNLDEEGKLALVEGVSDFSTLSKGDPSFFPTIQQIFKEGDSVNLLSYEASSIVSSGSVPLVTRTVAGFSSSIETIVFEDKRPFPTALLPTGKGAIFSTFSSPVINRNIIDITKKLGNNS